MLSGVLLGRVLGVKDVGGWGWGRSHVRVLERAVWGADCEGEGDGDAVRGGAENAISDCCVCEIVGANGVVSGDGDGVGIPYRWCSHDV